jgi:multidrug resistance efflux pump
LADVNPTFNWVRLAQRVPVRIHIDQLPVGQLLVAGHLLHHRAQGQARKNLELPRPRRDRDRVWWGRE